MMRYTWHGQILSVILTHLEASAIFFVVWLIAIGVTGTRIGGFLYSSASAVFYTVMMYSVGYSAVADDKKSHTKLTPIPYKGAVIALGLVLLNILVVLLYKLSWSLGSEGGELVKLWAVVGNILGLFWFSPCVNLLGISKGSIAVYGYAIIFFLHTIVCFLGYFAGYKNFDISAKLKFLVYEKK